MTKQLKALAQTTASVLILIGIYILSSLISSWITASIISLLSLSQQELTQLPLVMLILVPSFLTNLLLLFGWVRLVEKRPLQALGLPPKGAWKSLLQGSLIAFLINSALVASLMAFGLVRFQGIGPAAPQLGNLYSIKIKKQTRKQAAGCTGVRQGDADVV